jgi:hypothetical protein
VSLWSLPPRELAVTLFQLLDTAKEGPAAYYADVTQAVIILAITTPPAHQPTAPTSWPAWTRSGWNAPGLVTGPAYPRSAPQ